MFESNIYIKKIDIINLKNINEKKIKSIIEEELGTNENNLINYEIHKKEKNMYLYSIVEDSFLSRIVEKLDEVEIIPIQFYFIKLIRKKVRKDNFKCILNYFNIYYFLEVNNGYLCACYIWHSIDEAIVFFNRIEDKSNLYVQKGINLEDNDIMVVDYGGLYNDKIFL